MPTRRRGAEAPPSVRNVDLDVRTMLAFCGSFAALVAVTALVRGAPRTMTALAVGTLLALSLNPLVEGAERRLHVRRVHAVGIVFATFALVVTALAVVLIPPAAKQAANLGDDLPRVVRQLGDLPFVGHRLAQAGVPDRVLHAVHTLPQRLSGDLTPLAGVARSAARALAAATVVALF